MNPFLRAATVDAGDNGGDGDDVGVGVGGDGNALPFAIPYVVDGRLPPPFLLLLPFVPPYEGLEPPFDLKMESFQIKCKLPIKLHLLFGSKTIGRFGCWGCFTASNGHINNFFNMR